MRRHRATILAIAFGLALAMPAATSAHTSKAAYDYHVGDALIGSIGFPTNSQAMADNGDVVTIVGTGSFSADGKWADGGGTFRHHVAATDATITGTWVATSLISYQSYGCGADAGAPLPPNFCGGVVKLAITHPGCEPLGAPLRSADDHLRRRHHRDAKRGRGRASERV